MKFTDVIKRIGQTDKNTGHTYGQWYDQWFEDLEYKPLNILEVGVCVFGGGGSLALADYFNSGHVWAVDIDRRQCCGAVFTHPRITFIEHNAYRPTLLERLGDTKFDIIIDDASHEMKDQLQLLKMLRPRLNDDGFYVIEDCCTRHWLPHLPEVWDLKLQHTIIDMSTAKSYDNTLIRLDPIQQ